MSPSSVRVAVVQPEAVYFDPERNLAEACAWIRRAGAERPDLILLPEAYVGGYPWGLRFGTAIGGRTEEGRTWFARYHAGAIDVPGPATAALGEAAREVGATVAIGVIERDSTFGGGTLYCTLLYFGPDGTLLGKHRKLKPTAGERTVWGEGDGSTLPVVDLPAGGRVGGLICWENYMPLARTAMYAKGVQIWVAPTADARDRWQATMRHIAVEGRCFVLGCNQFVTRSQYPDDPFLAAELGDRPDVLSPGGSVIVSPHGDVLAGPLSGEAGVLTATLDLGEIARARFDFDVVGHYARPDVFRLVVDETPHPPVAFSPDRA
ncbi:MAG: carbon-nitrogen hydrolase family protein [Gemmatimonadetes bacterium]|nr:carbon-nitrogen hydrolase family protein [Gemmatimonadota bacterium]